MRSTRDELEQLILREILRHLQRDNGKTRPCLNFRRCGGAINLKRHPLRYFCDAACWRQLHTVPGQLRRLKARARRAA